MPLIQFAEWMPDVAALGNPGALRITNCLPGPNSYQPVGMLSPNTAALPSRPLGAISLVDRDNNLYQYAGDADDLYILNGSDWVVASRSGGYSASQGNRWEFAQWKNTVIATNYSDDIQVAAIGSSFADLGAPFKAKHIAVIRDHVFAANTFDGDDGAVPDRVRWSAFNNSADWTVSPSTGADARDLQKGGAIKAILGGEFGIMISDTSTWRITWTGAPTWFQIDEVLPGIGTIASGSVVQWGDFVYFLSEQGFVAIQAGSGVSQIGAGKVDRFIRNDLDENHLDRITATVDPRGGRIIWAYPGAGNVGGRPNRIVVYDRTFNKWSMIEHDVELLWSAKSPGYTLEGLDAVSADIDALPVSLDSPRWQGGRPQFAGFDSLNRSGFFDGPYMAAEIETQEVELYPGHRTMLNAFRPVIDGGMVRARIGERSRQSDPVVWSQQLNQSASGRFTHRSNARYHRFRVRITGNDWTDAIGVQLDAKDARRNDGRG
jgi:hypothetical protein